MRHLRAVRALTALSLVIPASVATWAVTGSASATAATSCSAEKPIGGNVLKSALSGCTDPANTGGKGTAVSKVGKGTTGTTTITWNKTGTTTLSWTYAVVKPNKCPSGSVEIKQSGKVTGGTGKAIKSITKGQAASGTFCENAKGSGLLKGTVWTF